MGFYQTEEERERDLVRVNTNPYVALIQQSPDRIRAIRRSRYEVCLELEEQAAATARLAIDKAMRSVDCVGNEDTN